MELGLEKLVANPEDVVKLVRKRAVQEKIKADVDEEAWDAVFNMEVIHSLRIKFTTVSINYLLNSQSTWSKAIWKTC